jgi:hypothetical protein
VPRLAHFHGTYLGDELSTLYIVKNHGLGDVLSSVSSDAEISPPLFFVLGWACSKLGSAPELLRLPSLIAGIAAIPLTYMVGRRAIGRVAGIIAAAAMAFNPFMVFYSTDGRAYALAIALLLASTLAMLIAIETSRTRWWIAYGAFTVLCMYAHYTTAFVLGAQLLWLLWAHPEVRKPALLANVGAAAAFAPWLPSMLDDFHSPTIDILSNLQGDGFAVKRQAVEAWAFGYPFNAPREVPGVAPIAISSAALVAASLAGVWRWRRRAAEGVRPPVSRGLVLVVVLGIATPVAELIILGLGGSDLFGARNLITASPGFALTIGAVAASGGMVWGTACVLAVLGTFGISVTRSFEDSVSTIQLKEAAAFIDERAGPDDVVVDMVSPVLSPVPLTSVDVYLSHDGPEYRPYLPRGKPPFLHYAPPPRPILRRAIRSAAGGRLFLVAVPGQLEEDSEGTKISLPPAKLGRDEVSSVTLGSDWHIVDRAEYEGLSDVMVIEFENSTPRPGK